MYVSAGSRRGPSLTVVSCARSSWPGIDVTGTEGTPGSCRRVIVIVPLPHAATAKAVTRSARRIMAWLLFAMPTT